MAQPLLRALDVSKTYTLWHQPADRLMAPAWRALAGRLGWVPPLRRRLLERADRLGRSFVALRPISLEIERGQAIGIIGRNGSGKSTLLQILAGTLTPSTGIVERLGRVAALLELGSGFNPEFTGRENVFLQASIYDIPAARMQQHYEEVATFADIGQFIDQPVKTYSSGMLVRLAFAVQVVLRPDVLIVDEALAVGDVFFQAKCAAYFRERLAEGMAMIFVSHDLVSLRALCQEAIVLDQGSVKYRGGSKEATNIYHELHSSDARGQLRANGGGETAKPRVRRVRNWQSTDEIGTREVEIASCEILDERGEPRGQFAEGEDFRIRLYVQARADVPVVHGAFQIVDRHNRALYGVSTAHLEAGSLQLQAGQEAVLDIWVPGRLGAGEYLLDAALGWGDRGDGAFTHQCHRIGGIAAISVGRVTLRPRFLGPVDLGARLAWSEHEPESSGTIAGPG